MRTPEISYDPAEDSVAVCHEGYISIMPLILGLVDPESPHLLPLLESIHDRKRLRSAFGIRSLSLSHELFGTGENYWRGAIWMPMNYLILQSLHNVRSYQSF